MNWNVIVTWSRNDKTIVIKPEVIDENGDFILESSSCDHTHIDLKEWDNLTENTQEQIMDEYQDLYTRILRDNIHYILDKKKKDEDLSKIYQPSLILRK